LFIGTYNKRFTQVMEVPISKYLLTANLAVLTSLVVINIFKIRSEKKLK
jgi:hypothetical protein